MNRDKFISIPELAHPIVKKLQTAIATYRFALSVYRKLKAEGS